MKNNDLNIDLENSLKGDELVNTGLDIAEIAIDQFLNEGVLRDIPILNSVLSLIKSGVSIKEALFLKKLLLFIEKIQEVPCNKREKFLITISNIQTEKKRLFEKILLTIERLDDTEKSILLGKVFKHLIVGNINLIQYYRIARVIEDMMMAEINFFFYQYGYYSHNDETRERYHYYMMLVGSDNLKDVMMRNGLFEVIEELKFDENTRQQQYRVKKSESLTSLGRLFAEFGFDGFIYLKNPVD